MKLICQNCNQKEDLQDINIRGESLICIAQKPRKRRDGLDIFPLLCFGCNFVSEFASDPTNISGKAVDGVEYFETFKLTERYKKIFLAYAKENKLHSALTKIQRSWNELGEKEKKRGKTKKKKKTKKGKR